MDIEIDINSYGLQDLLLKLQRKQNNWRQELYDIGIYMLRSIDKNFTEQGRPTRWRQSLAAQQRQGMTLVDTGRLRRSVTVFADSDAIFDLNNTRLGMSTKVEYAKYLQNDWPFFVVQDEDIEIMQDIVRRGLDNI